MKIKGRFIAVLAAVGLLVALLPALPTGAVVGTLTLNDADGEEATHFSTNDGFNVVTIEVKDPDLSPVRNATARYARAEDTNDIASFYLKSAALAGEMEHTEPFDGGLSNVVCAIAYDAGVASGGTLVPGNFAQVPDYTERVVSTGSVEAGFEVADTARHAKVYYRSNAANAISVDATGALDGEGALVAADDYAAFVAAGCEAQGDAIGLAADGSLLEASDTDAALVGRWNFELPDDMSARDMNNDGTIDAMDVEVEADGESIVVFDANANAGTPESVGYMVGIEGSGGTNEAGDPAWGIRSITLMEEPSDGEETVSVSYEYSEYTFGSDTPIVLEGLTIHYDPIDDSADDATSFSTATSRKQIDATDDSAATVTATSALGLSNVTHVLIRFEYEVQDEVEDNVLVSTDTSLADGVDVELDGKENGTATDVFKSTVALFSVDDYAAIKAAVDDSKGIAHLGRDLEADLFKRITGGTGPDVTGVLAGLGLVQTDPSQALLDQILPVRHGNSITVSYGDDGASTISQSAMADLEGPVVTLVSPTAKYNQQGVLTLTATAEDMDAGIAEGMVDIEPVTQATLGTTSKTQIVSDQKIIGYTVSAASTEAFTEGEHKWYVGVTDKVGNGPDPDEAGSSSVKPFTFNVDSVAPELITTGVAGETGKALDNIGVSEGEDDEIEQEKDDAEWLRVDLNLGEGLAPVDAETVGADDFLVDGATPLEAVVNLAGDAVYLKMGSIATDAQPTVALSGDISDKAGNRRTSGTSSLIVDRIPPELTITTSADISDTEVVVTIQASEALQASPTLYLRNSHPEGVVPTRGELTPTRSVGVSPPTWTYTREVYTSGNGEANKLFIIVEATDSRQNDATVGKGSATDAEKDIITFQVDSMEPGLKFLANGTVLDDDNEPEEGSVWVVAQFDENEYPGDTFRKVTLTAATLTNSEGTVITDNVADLFGENDVACTDHDDPTNTADKCATYTLAVELAEGEYTIAASGVDSAGNSVSDDTTFTVGPRDPFELELKPGVNLVSIPGSPVGDGGNLNVLFEDLQGVSLVTTYDRSLDVAGQNPWLRSTRDPETGLFTGDISTLQPGAAYFITSEARVDVEITLRTVIGELPPTMMVRFGYNAIGYSSIQPTPSAQPIDDYLNSIPWTVAYSYDPTPGRGWEVLRPGSSEPGDDVETVMAEPGKGYLVFSQFDATLTP